MAKRTADKKVNRTSGTGGGGGTALVCMQQLNCRPSSPIKLEVRAVIAHAGFVQRSVGRKSRSTHERCPDTVLTVIMRRHLCHQEWKFLGYIDAHTELFRKIGAAVCEGKDNVNDLTRTAQRRGAYIHPGERAVPPKLFGCLGINAGVAHSQVIQSSVLVGRTGVVRHLHDPVKQLLRGCADLRGRGLVWLRDSSNEYVAVERID